MSVNVKTEEGLLMVAGKPYSGDVLTPHMFGAKGDGATDDTEALQAFFDKVSETGIKGTISSGEYLTSSPLILKCPSLEDVSSDKQNFHFEVIGNGSVIIRKTNHSKYNDKDAVVVIKNKNDESTSFNIIIKGIDFIGCGTGHYLATNANEYGIFVEGNGGIFYGIFEDILVRGVQDGINGSFYMTQFNRVSCHSSRYGFAVNAGTSLSFNNCYCELQQTAAYFLYLCVYTTLTSCGADGVNGTAYDIRFGCVTLNNCGAENLYGEHIFNFRQCYVSINGGYYLASPYLDTQSIVLSSLAKVTAYNVRISTHYNITDASPDIAKGSLFSVESQAYIDFYGCYLCQYEQESNWEANFSHKRNQIQNFEMVFDTTKNIMTYKDKDGIIRDTKGNPIGSVFVVNGSNKIADYYVLGDTGNYTVTQDENGIHVDGANTDGQTNVIYLVFSTSIYNYKRFTMVSSLESSYSGADGSDGGVSIHLANGEQIEALDFSGAYWRKNTPYAETTNIGAWEPIVPQIYGKEFFVIRLKTQPFAGQTTITHRFTLRSLKFE